MFTSHFSKSVAMSEPNSMEVGPDDDGPVATEELGELADFTEFQMDVSRFRRMQKLGEGTFGVVYLAHDPQSEWTVVVKELRQPSPKQRECEFFKREIEILLRAHNPFVLPCLGFSIRSPYALVSPYIESGSLWDLMHKRRTIVLNPSQKTSIAVGIAHGMRYLHRSNIIHRDLKSPNILLDSLLVPKIADFGLAKLRGISEKQVSVVGTPQWMAPELMQGKADRPADVFSFGIILYEMLTEKVPYAERPERGQALCKLIADGYHPPLQGVNELEKLILQCWSINPSDRPTFDQIYIWLSTSLIQFPGTVPQAVRSFIRLKIENEVEPVNAVAQMTSNLNQLLSTQRHLQGKRRSIPDAFCYFAENGAIKDMARYIRTVPSLDINGCNSDGVCFAFKGHHSSAPRTWDITSLCSFLSTSKELTSINQTERGQPR
jgi:serine/threonine protein kinase